MIVARIIVSLSIGLLFFALYWFSKGKGMGFGDIYLSAFVGLILGFPRGLMAIYFAFIAGGLIGLILLILKRKKLKSKIAFGPFLAASGIIFMLFPDLEFAILHIFGLY